jgi:hypothetical protein
MRKFQLIAAFLGVSVIFSSFTWGFYAHKRINRMAVFTLPSEMIGFYKANIGFIEEAAVNPDRRRFSVVDEAPRHYIDIDHYGDSAITKMPRFWDEAVNKYSEDTLKAYGIVPWHINTMFYRLREAFLLNDPDRILKLSAELGHYIADANVPLHTTENYNGQLTGQEGIHAFWESRLPELFSEEYDFFIGKADYLPVPQLEAWKAVIRAHKNVDSVLRMEKWLSEEFGDKKYSFETKGRQTQKIYSQEYAAAYHEMLEGMVEQQMRSSIKMIGDFWFTAWVDAGQPDLKRLIHYKPSPEDLKKRKEEITQWRKEIYKSRLHEND